MSFIIVFLVILICMVVCVAIEGLLIPSIKIKKGNERVIKNEYVDDLFEKTTDYISAVHRKNSDLPIDSVFVYDERAIELIKEKIASLAEVQ